MLTLMLKYASNGPLWSLLSLDPTSSFGEGGLGEATGAELVKECGDLLRRTSVFARGGVHDGKHTDHTASR
jgi:hypothetical protein